MFLVFGVLCARREDNLSNLGDESFFTYFWLNGQTFVGPDTDNAKYAEVKPETWEDFLSKRKLEDLTHAYFALAK